MRTIERKYNFISITAASTANVQPLVCINVTQFSTKSIKNPTSHQYNK